MNSKAVLKKIFTSRWLIFSAAAVTVYALLGFFLVPNLASHYLKKYVKDYLAHELVLQKLRFNPFTFAVVANEFGIEEKNGSPLLAIGFFSANFDSWASIYHRAWTFSNIKVTNPFMHVVLIKDGRSNLSDLLKELTAKTGKQPVNNEKHHPMPKVLFEQVTVRGGKIDFTDQRESPPANVQLKSLTLDLKELTTLADRTGGYLISGRAQTGERFKWRGTVSLNPIRSAGSFKLDSVKTATIWQFLRDKFACNAPGGEMGISGDYLIDLAGRKPAFTLHGLDFDISNLAVTLKGATSPLLSLKSVAGRNGKLQWQDRSLTLETLRVEGGQVKAEVNQSGISNWKKLTANDEKATSGNIAAAPLDINQGPDNTQNPPTKTKWRVSLPSFKLNNFQVYLTDLTTDPSTILTLASLNLDLTGLSTDPDATVDFALHTKIKQGGQIVVKGKTKPWQREAAGHLQITDFSLLPLQPHLNQVARLTLESGSVDASGEFSYSRKAAQNTFTYRGEGKIPAFKVRSNDPAKPIWGWDSLSCSDINLSLSPDILKLGNVDLVGLRGSLIISKNHTVNLSKILIQKNEKKTAEKSGFKIEVDSVNIEQGAMEFADFSLSPRFDVLIHNLQGVFAGISSVPQTPAELSLQGQVGKYGFVRIHGKSDPVNPTDTTNIRIDFQNIEMTRLTPFSIHFAGYRIASGKLFLNLDYRIQEGKMEGQNHIITKQMTLGKRVKSPTALDLPFQLAVALLKNPDGTIELDLPVSGDLRNPHFAFGQIIRKALGNLLEKIVTAPFSWLAALVGHENQNFEMVSFDPGRSTLLPPEQEKLSELSKALAKRPRLALKIQGRYNQEADVRALKSILLRRNLAVKEHQPLSPGEEPGPIVFQNPDTRRALEALFLEHNASEQLSKLKADFRQTLPQEEKVLPKKEQTAAWNDFYRDLYRRLKEMIAIPGSRLKALAGERAASMRRFLVSTEQINPDRIKILEPGQTGESNGREIKSKLSLDVAG